MSTGIYKITNKINGKFYIGSALNCFTRWGKKYNNHLEASFLKHGKENFSFEIIEEIADKTKLIEREQYYIDLLKPEYNQRKIASSNLGIKVSNETRKKLSEARKKRIITKETREKLSKTMKGRKIEWADKIRKANSGENNYNYGNHLDDKHKEKISESLLGIIRSEETRKKISESKSGKKFSDEHKRNLSEAAKNRKKQTVDES